MNHPIAEELKQSIRLVPDFPKAGITFYDITTLTQNGPLFNKVIDVFYERYKSLNIDAVAGLESRGFIFGAPLATKLGVSFVPVRKPGKLPAETISASYDTEYSTDSLEIHRDSLKPGDRVVIADDLLATGGTASSAIKLVHTLNAEVIECAIVIELVNLNGRNKLGDTPIMSLLNCDG